MSGASSAITSDLRSGNDQMKQLALPSNPPCSHDSLAATVVCTRASCRVERTFRLLAFLAFATCSCSYAAYVVQRWRGHEGTSVSRQQRAQPMQRRSISLHTLMSALSRQCKPSCRHSSMTTLMVDVTHCATACRACACDAAETSY